MMSFTSPRGHRWLLKLQVWCPVIHSFSKYLIGRYVWGTCLGSEDMAANRTDRNPAFGELHPVGRGETVNNIDKKTAPCAGGACGGEQ